MENNSKREKELVTDDREQRSESKVTREKKRQRKTDINHP